MPETDDADLTLPAFRYLSGESANICRLCFGATDRGVYMDEIRLIQCHYYDDTVTFEDMLRDLGAIIDISLPQMLCKSCADAAVNSFLFRKLCTHSYKIWHESLEKFNKTLDLSDSLSPTVKTAYFVQHESNLILSTRKLLKKKNKEVALRKLQELVKAREKYAKVKRKSDLICEECGENFPRKSYLARHKRIHSRKKFSCPQCPKLFPSQTQLRDHCERLHRPKTIQCTKCAKMFSSEKMLRSHDLTNHTAAICNRCFIQFPSKNDLRQHLNKHDVNQCTRCNKEYLNNHSFKQHLKLCGNEDRQLKVFCDICNNGYAHKSGLRSHLIVKHGFGRVYTCNWCKKPFDAVSKLKNHIVKHTRERNFHCIMCGGQFVTQAALIYHTRIHTGEKPFPCDLCEESFLSASRRMEHKRRKHLGPNKECPVCHNRFVTSHELQKHAARHKNPQSRLYVAEKKSENSTSGLKCKIINFIFND